MQDVDKASVDNQLERIGISPALMANAQNISYLNSKSGSNVKDKPEGSIGSHVLRSFSVNYPIARACIDYTKGKISQLDWDIVNANEEGDDVKGAEDIKAFFDTPMGVGSSLNEMLEFLTEDNLVLGAIAVEKMQTKGGGLLELLPVDVGTIKLRLNEQGRSPKPPEIAYEQWVSGTKTAELTADEMIFKVRNLRTNTPFGLSPLESLIIQVQSALAGSLYNFKFFTDSNQVEGFVGLPEDLTNDQVKEFQEYFDAMVAGDPRFQRRLKFMPHGFEYIPTKKPEDMSFQRFELWLLQQTCAVFGVPPQDIGFTFETNKATAEVQSDKGQERVRRPIAMWFEGIFTNIIQIDLGRPDLKFSFINVDPTDRKVESEIDEIRIRSGIQSVDEVRRREGLEEIGLEHYVMTSGGPVLVEDIINRKNVPVASAEGSKKPVVESVAAGVDLELEEVKQWKKCAVNDFKAGKPFRAFNHVHIQDEVVEDIKKQLGDVSDRDGINSVFSIYLNGDYDSVVKLRRLSSAIQQYI